MHIWRLEKVGRFPRRVKLGPNSVGWVSTEIDAWIEARIAERDAALATRGPSAVEAEMAEEGGAS
jgi:prophage regulatory protein